MTRNSDLGLFLLAVLLAAPASAEPLISDAFGLYDRQTAGDGRPHWAGWIDGGAGARIAPQAPDQVIIFAGPKSIVAGKDPGHVVAIAVDRFGNLINDGTAATVTVAGAARLTQTTGGIADTLIGPRPYAEDLFVGVTIGQRQSPKAMISVVADIDSIRPGLAGPVPDVVSESRFEVVSAPLVDRFGNPVPQGTGAQVLLRHGDSYSLGQGLAPSDRALIRFIARDIFGPATATMTLGARSSEPVALSIRTPAPAGNPALERESLDEIGAQRLTLGPFLTTDGYALADGAQVSVIFALADGRQVDDAAWVRDGEVSLLLPFSDPDAVRKLTVQSPLGAMDLTADWHATNPNRPEATEQIP